jgi:hypothetical protein
MNEPEEILEFEKAIVDIIDSFKFDVAPDTIVTVLIAMSVDISFSCSPTPHDAMDNVFKSLSAGLGIHKFKKEKKHCCCNCD